MKEELAAVRRLVREGRYAEALAYCDSGLSRDPDDAALIAEKARLLVMPFPGLDSPNEAVSLLEEALERQPASVQLHEALGFVYEHGMAEYRLARQQYEQALRLNPRSAETYLALGRLFQTPGVDMTIETGLEYLKRGVELAPSHWELHRELATLYWRAGALEKAEVEYRLALSSEPPPDDMSARQIREWLRRLERREPFESGYLQPVR